MYANRFHYFIKNVWREKNDRTIKKGRFAALQNEVFINYGNTSAVNEKFFEQNRLYLATGFWLGPKADLEIGYMNQYVNGRGSQFTNSPILHLVGYLKL